jgi:lipopolysaccharide transport system permease protein
MPTTTTVQQDWTLEITPKRGLLSIPIREIWAYRDLLLLLVRRDFVALYKQTILGPLWFLIQPLLTTIVFTVVFGNIAQLSTDGLPQILFYLSGITCWNYFSETLTKTSETFTANANIFGKVYFPRMIMPLSIVASNLLKLGIQLVLFVAFIVWYRFSGTPIEFNATILLFPVLVAMMAGLGLGIGMIVASLTTKYRDLRFLFTFAVQLLMYATPVIYPTSSLPDKYKLWIMLNPITPIIETFRHAFLGQGEYNTLHLVYGMTCTVLVVVIGTVIFNRVEKTFMDSV